MLQPFPAVRQPNDGKSFLCVIIEFLRRGINIIMTVNCRIAFGIVLSAGEVDSSRKFQPIEGCRCRGARDHWREIDQKAEPTKPAYGLIKASQCYDFHLSRPIELLTGIQKAPQL